jgi:hypothetical protein
MNTLDVTTVFPTAKTIETTISLALAMDTTAVVTLLPKS